MTETITYLTRGAPALAVETVEEERYILALLQAVAAGAWEGPAHRVLLIAAVGGLKELTLSADGSQYATSPVDPSASFAKAFAALGERTLLLVLDWQHTGGAAYRPLRDILPAAKRHESAVILIAPHWQLPAEIQHEIPVLRWSLPSREQLGTALDTCAEGALHTDMPAGADRESLLDAAAGLTLNEAELAYALAARRESFARERVEREKMALVRQSGLLEITPPANPDTVGGLSLLKSYLSSEVLPSLSDPELRVRGVLMVGVPGTGKSLAAKACGALLGRPILRCDLSALMGSLVGASETNLRKALAIAEAVAPAVLFFDEIEKGVGGHASSAATDGGTTLRMVGTLLTWLQEHTSDVLTVATCNDYAKLPAELARAGRFDERFFVDLPTLAEREEIAEIHLRRFTSLRAAPVPLAEGLARLTPGWTGAELEQAVKSACRRTARVPAAADLAEACASIKPLSETRRDEISALRQWATGALRPASAPEQALTGGTGRRIHV